MEMLGEDFRDFRDFIEMLMNDLTQEDKGYVKEGLVTNSDGFLRRWARGVPTLDLVVLEFWR